MSRWATSLALLGWLALSTAGRMAQAQEPSRILHNGKILTVDSNFSTAEAVAIRGRQFAAVGGNQDILRLAGPDTLAIDLKGRTVIPGLIETHAPLHNYAERTYGAELTDPERASYPVDLRGVASKQDVLNQIQGLMEKYSFPPGEWISFATGVFFTSGGTVDQAKIMMDDLNRWELDQVAPDNPVALSIGIPNFNGFLVNSKAIELLWEQYGDFIEHYGRYWIDSEGKPEGHFEPPASRIILKLLPSRPPAALARMYRKHLDEASAMGITTVSTRMPPDTVEAFRLLESNGEMTLRLGYGREELFGTLTNLETDMAALGSIIGTGSDKIWVTSVAPTAVDGASTRACTAQKRVSAYGSIDRWWPAGQCHTDIEFRGAQGKGAPIQGNYFREWVLNSGRYGVRFANTHVAGDRSVGLLLSMVEQVQQENGPAATNRWAFDHCVFVNPADFERAARLGIMFSCAPKYIESVAPAAAKSYGEEMAHTFVVPVKSMMDAGIKVVFEADRFFEDMYAWHDMELFMTRKDREGNVWGPQERLDRETVLKMITRWAAEYLLRENELGSIEAGKLADLVVLDRDYMTIPEEEISEIQPQLTVLGGEIVFVHPRFANEYNLRPAGALVT
ncbi:MAG: amidohydrolase family protein, partial [Acidobacteria bacterium]|nr:amidohydrolase family protein [Acidobacteriota bacterium]